MDAFVEIAESMQAQSPNVGGTLVFIDLETTGLPSTVGGGRNVEITELCFMAIDREQFKTNGDIRVINKLTLTVRPNGNISEEVETLTGLSNTSLQFQKTFSPSTAQLIKAFLERLNDPVCLLAHNGYNFDFKVLKTEIDKVKCMLPDSVYCYDTLPACREMWPELKHMKQRPYSLESLYEYLFKYEIPKAHSAECDCEALIKVSRHINDFLLLVDKNMISFKNIKEYQ